MCYFTGIFYAVIRQITMLFIDNQILYSVLLNLMLPVLPIIVIITVVFLLSFFFFFFFLFFFLGGGGLVPYMLYRLSFKC